MNKIGWCDMTLNPVIGCKNNCSYCYAKRINDRFNFIEDFNIPEWRGKSFNKKLPKKPQRIFVGSMSEIAHWETMWVLKVLNKIEQYPQHIFQLLTKHPDVYLRYKFPDNCHLGVTITKIPKNLNNESMSIIEFLHDTCFNNLKFISFEPLLERIDISRLDLRNIGWVIIGAETGNRRGKVIPDLDWVLDIVRYCGHNKIPIYIKDNLVRYYHDCVGYKQFPKPKKIILQNNKNMLK